MSTAASQEHLNKDSQKSYDCITEKSQPKLRGGAKTPKLLTTNSENIQNLLTILRSLEIFTKLNGHAKCELEEGKKIQSSLCEFCLIRSLIIRSNSLKGRTKIRPVEFLGYDEEYLNSLSLKDVMNFYFQSIYKYTDW